MQLMQGRRLERATRRRAPPQRLQPEQQDNNEEWILTPTPIPIPLTPRTPRQERAWSFKVRGKRARKKENTYTGLPYTPLPYYSYPRYLRERTVCLRKYAGRRKGKVGLGWRHRRQSSRPACDFGMGVSCRVCQDCHGFLI